MGSMCFKCHQLISWKKLYVNKHNSPSSTPNPKQPPELHRLQPLKARWVLGAVEEAGTRGGGQYMVPLSLCSYNALTVSFYD